MTYMFHILPFPFTTLNLNTTNITNIIHYSLYTPWPWFLAFLGHGKLCEALVIENSYSNFSESSSHMTSEKSSLNGYRLSPLFSKHLVYLLSNCINIICFHVCLTKEIVNFLAKNTCTFFLCLLISPLPLIR